MDALFRSLGLHDTETKVYLSLADAGGCAAGMLAKRIGIPRTTIYSALENLTAKGLVSLEEQGGITRYLANPPSSLLLLVNREREEIDRKAANAKELMQLLTPFFGSRGANIPRLQFFEGKKNVESMLHEFLPAWRESIKRVDNVWWGYQDHTFVTDYRAWLDSVWSSMEVTERVYLVSNHVPLEKKLSGKVRGREIRVLSEKSEFSSTIWVLGSFIVMIYSREKPNYAFQIRDDVFSANLRSVFKVLWQNGKSKIK